MSIWMFFCIVVLLLNPRVASAVHKVILRRAYPDDKLFMFGSAPLFMRDIVFCLIKDISGGHNPFTPDGFTALYLGCFKEESTMRLVEIVGWDAGVAAFPMGLSGAPEMWGPMFLSHAAYKKAVYDPSAGRPAGMFILSNRSQLPPGVIPADVDRTLLEFDTGDAEWRVRRDLMKDALPALGSQSGSGAGEVVPAPGVSPRDGANPRAVKSVLAVTLFRWLFDVDVTAHVDAILEYDQLFAGAVFGAFTGGKKGGARLNAIREEIGAIVAAGPVGKQYLETARSRGMPAETRLRELVWIVMFAAFGGTGNLATMTLRHIMANPAKNVPIFRSDVDAFMLEAARLFPPVGGMNPIALRRPTQMLAGDASVVAVQAGAWGMTITTTANRDPFVFAEPDLFLPGRPLNDRLLTWNAELRHIRDGSAPRGCPGTFLALRLATAVVSYFVAGADEMLREQEILPWRGADL